MDCCSRFLQRMEHLGVHQVSLLVVPNWYDRYPLAAHPEFCDWLRTLPHDIALHGYTHRSGQRHQKPLEWLVARKYTAGEGEFYKLGVEEAEQLLADGLHLFREAGLQPNGFIAPAWLMSEALLPAMKRSGFRYVVTYGSVHDLQTGSSLRAPVLCTTSRTALRRILTRPVVSGLARMYAGEQNLRIAVHPMDLQFPKIENYIYDLIERALSTRQVVTYADLVSHHFAEGHGKNDAAEEQVEMVGEDAPKQDCNTHHVIRDERG